MGESVPSDWAPTRTPEERRQVWEAIQDEAETDWWETVDPGSGTVRDAVCSRVDTQILRGVVLGQKPVEPKAEIPAGKTPSDRWRLFTNLSPAGLFNLAFAFLILVVLAIKARSGG
jgi:hypothetical protein